jgi:hypothetical protein
MAVVNAASEGILECLDNRPGLLVAAVIDHHDAEFVMRRLSMCMVEHGREQMAQRFVALKGADREYQRNRR